MHLSHIYTALAVVVLCILYIKAYNSGQVAIEYGPHTYYVNNNQESSQKFLKAKTLHTIRLKIESLMDVLKDSRYLDQVPIQTLLRKYKHKHIQLDELPNLPSLQTTFAFNVNKGERISVCLSKENTLNDLFFVVLHELAHSMTKEYAHNTQFWDNFKRLIEIAIEHSIYINQNYSKTPSNFCNYVLNHNPFFDEYVTY
jgi:hypothetical protein